MYDRSGELSVQQLIADVSVGDVCQERRSLANAVENATGVGALSPPILWETSQELCYISDRCREDKQCRA